MSNPYKRYVKKIFSEDKVCEQMAEMTRAFSLKHLAPGLRLISVELKTIPKETFYARGLAVQIEAHDKTLVSRTIDVKSRYTEKDTGGALQELLSTSAFCLSVVFRKAKNWPEFAHLKFDESTPVTPVDTVEEARLDKAMAGILENMHDYHKEVINTYWHTEAPLPSMRK